MGFVVCLVLVFKLCDGLVWLSLYCIKLLLRLMLIVRNVSFYRVIKIDYWGLLIYCIKIM